MTDTRTSPSPDKTRKPITCLELNFTNLPPLAGYFVVSVHRGDWNTDDSRVRFYYRPSRASLLRVNRAQRLFIRRITGHGGYVAELPVVTIIPEDNTELRQLVTTELETEQRWTAEEIWQREG